MKWLLAKNCIDVYTQLREGMRRVSFLAHSVVDTWVAPRIHAFCAPTHDSHCANSAILQDSLEGFMEGFAAALVPQICVCFFVKRILPSEVRARNCSFEDALRALSHARRGSVSCETSMPLRRVRRAGSRRREGSIWSCARCSFVYGWRKDVGEEEESWIWVGRCN